MNLPRRDWRWHSVLVFLLTLALFGVPLTFWRAGNPFTVSAQTPTRIGQQTYTYKYSWTPNGTQKTFVVPNLGQVSHSIALSQTFGVGGQCTLFFEGSNDNSTWITMASVPHGHFFYPYDGSATAFGQYTFFRIDFNSSADSSCTYGTAVTVFYVGYTFPASTGAESANVIIANVASQAKIVAQDSSPQIIVGMTCYNPNSSAAFLEITDAPGSDPSPPAISSIFEFAIPGTSSAIVSTNNLLLQFGGWLAAVTAQGGTTPVSNALSCSVQMNLKGPFN